MRILIGDSSAAPGAAGRQPITETIVVLETNLDNATGETISHAVEQLWAAGALDVALTSIQMKKARPGILISVQVRPSDADRLETVLFLNTPTLGIRRSAVARTVLPRESREVQTPFGWITGKIAHLPGGATRFSPEYDACRQMAEQQNVPIDGVFRAAQQAFERSGE